MTDFASARPIFFPERIWRCGDFRLPLGSKTHVMAILNATPDSFSGDGFFAENNVHRVLDIAVERALAAIENGADILDIGGESTRPGASEVSIEEETRRVVPLIERLASQITVPISVDTTKSAVARRALDAGASIVNDISGATADAQMWPLLAQSTCGIVLMHRRGNSQKMKASEATDAPKTDDVIAEVLGFWRECIREAERLKIARDRITFDAGFGFGKSVGENLEIVRRGRELSDFGFPTLSGTSRKSTIDRVLDATKNSAQSVVSDADCVWGTAALTALAIQNGADIVRVHDVREMSNVARISDATLRIQAKMERSTQRTPSVSDG